MQDAGCGVEGVDINGLQWRKEDVIEILKVEHEIVL